MNTMLFQLLKKKKLGNKYYCFNLFLKTCNYDVWFENKESADTTKCCEELTNLPQFLH